MRSVLGKIVCLTGIVAACASSGMAQPLPKGGVVSVRGGTTLDFTVEHAGASQSECSTAISLFESEGRMNVSIAIPCRTPPGTYPLVKYSDAFINPNFADRFGIGVHWRGDADSRSGGGYTVTRGSIRLVSVAPYAAHFSAEGHDQNGTPLNITGSFANVNPVKLAR